MDLNGWTSLLVLSFMGFLELLIYIYIYMVRNPKTVHRYFDLSQLLRKKKQKTRSKGTSIKSQERFGVVNFFD